MGGGGSRGGGEGGKEGEGTYVVVAELEKDVGVLLVFEKVVELDDVPVVEGAVDADLGLELLGEEGREGGREGGRGVSFD